MKRLETVAILASCVCFPCTLTSTEESFLFLKSLLGVGFPYFTTASLSSSCVYPITVYSCHDGHHKTMDETCACRRSMRKFAVSAVVSDRCVVLAFTRSLHRSKRWEEFPDVEFTFDCSDKAVGFYADLDFDCQIFQMCDAFGRRVPHVCPNFTKFNQKFRVCDWSYNVDCEDAPNWYFLNDLTFEKDPEDIDSNSLDSDY